MRRSNLMFLLIGIAIIFGGCEKMDSLEPNAGIDQESSLLKAAKVHTKFTGLCTPITLSPVNTWYDESDDWRVTGTTIWITESVIQCDETTFKLRGTAELTLDDDGGKWAMTWHGTQTLTSPEGNFTIVAHAVGTGIEGEVEGLTARWKYTLDTADGFIYNVKGKITEEL